MIAVFLKINCKCEINGINFKNKNKNLSQIYYTRNSGHYAPFFLAPVEGWGAQMLILMDDR